MSAPNPPAIDGSGLIVAPHPGYHPAWAPFAEGLRAVARSLGAVGEPGLSVRPFRITLARPEPRTTGGHFHLAEPGGGVTAFHAHATAVVKAAEGVELVFRRANALAGSYAEAVWPYASPPVACAQIVVRVDITDDPCEGDEHGIALWSKAPGEVRPVSLVGALRVQPAGLERFLADVEVRRDTLDRGKARRWTTAVAGFRPARKLLDPEAPKFTWERLIAAGPEALQYVLAAHAVGVPWYETLAGFDGYSGDRGTHSAW